MKKKNKKKNKKNKKKTMTMKIKTKRDEGIKKYYRTYYDEMYRIETSH